MSRFLTCISFDQGSTPNVCIHIIFLKSAPLRHTRFRSRKTSRYAPPPPVSTYPSTFSCPLIHLKSKLRKEEPNLLSLWVSHQRQFIKTFFLKSSFLSSWVLPTFNVSSCFLINWENSSPKLKTFGLSTSLHFFQGGGLGRAGGQLWAFHHDSRALQSPKGRMQGGTIWDTWLCSPQKAAHFLQCIISFSFP